MRIAIFAQETVELTEQKARQEIVRLPQKLKYQLLVLILAKKPSW